jgi:hypothetical protein
MAAGLFNTVIMAVTGVVSNCKCAACWAVGPLHPCSIIYCAEVDNCAEVDCGSFCAFTGRAAVLQLLVAVVAHNGFLAKDGCIRIVETMYPLVQLLFGILHGG